MRKKHVLGLSYALSLGLALGCASDDPGSAPPSAGQGGSGGTAGSSGSSGQAGQAGGGGSQPSAAPVIGTFAATKLWGDAPLSTKLKWAFALPPGQTATCEFDTTGDGQFNETRQDCPTSGELALNLAAAGAVNAKFRVTSAGQSAEASELLYVNKVEWVKNLVRVRELPGLVQSHFNAATETVELTFAAGASMPTFKKDDVLWDNSYGGYVRKFVSAQKKGDVLEITSQRGGIFDIAKGGFWGQRSRGPDGSTTKALNVSGCEEYEYDSSYQVVKGVAFPDISLKSGKAEAKYTSGKALAAVSVSDVRFDFWTLYFEARARMQTRICGTYEANIDVPTLEKEVGIPSASFSQDIDLKLLHLNADFGAFLGVRGGGKIKGQVKTILGNEANLHLVVGWGKDPQIDVGFAEKNRVYDPTVEGEANVSVYAKAKLDLTWNHPQEECKGGKTTKNQTLRLGAEAEFGVRADASLKVGNGTDNQACLKAKVYVDGSAVAIPPIDWFGCKNVSATLAEQEIYNQCWDLSGGQGGAAGAAGMAGMAGSAGTSGSAGQGGAAGMAGSAGTSGSAGQGGMAGSAGASGGAGMAGSAGASGSGGQAGMSGAGGKSGSGGSGGGPAAGNSCAGGLTCNGESCCTSISIPGGTFAMGRSTSSGAPDYYSNGQANELPEHSATVAGFALDKYEVTVGRFRKFVNQYSGQPVPSGAGANPAIANSGWQNSWNGHLPSSQGALLPLLSCNSSHQTWTALPGANENAPMNCVNWYEAFAFCIWDGGRLPTEAEWEYAASGGFDRLYPWGSATPTKMLGNFRVGNSNGSAFTEVGSTPAGNARWGHADMAGSMWEWTLDLYDASWYTSNPTCNNCSNLSMGSYRVLRGGSFYNAAPHLRAAFRNSSAPTNRGNYHGFRCARTPLGK